MKFQTRRSLPWMIATCLIVLGTGSIYAYDNALSMGERRAVIRGVRAVASAGRSSAQAMGRVVASFRKVGR